MVNSELNLIMVNSSASLHKKKRNVKALILYILIIIVLTIFALLSFFPFYWMIYNAFKDPSLIFEHPVKLFSFDLSIESFKGIFTGENGANLWRSFGNSLIISLSATLGTLFTSSLAAYAFAKLHFFGKKVLFGMFVATLMLPGQVTMLPLFVIFANMGWTDTFLPLIIPGVMINTYGVFMLRQFIVSIPNEILEASEVDGCGYFRRYWHIVLPLLIPALITLGLFSFIGSWNNYFGQLIYLSSPENMTISLFIASLKDHSSTALQWGQILAASVISIVPISIIYLRCQKYFVQGIATTGIK